MTYRGNRPAPLLIYLSGGAGIALDGVNTANDAIANTNYLVMYPQAGEYWWKPEVAQRHTGYQVGGTSPFGLRKLLPVFVERSILALPAIYINGGRRGFLVRITPADRVRLLAPTPVDVARS